MITPAIDAKCRRIEGAIAHEHEELRIVCNQSIRTDGNIIPVRKHNAP
jgi:hypothetical protein